MRSNKFLTAVLSSGLLLVPATWCQATLLGYEPFDYSPGSVSSGNGGTGWNGSSNWSLAIPVTSPGTSYGLLEVDGNKAEVTAGVGAGPNRALGASVSSGSIWISFISKAVGNTSIKLIALQGYSGGVWIGEAFNSKWQIGVGTTTYTSTIANTSESFLLGRFDLNGTDVTGYLWVNPDLSAGEPAIGAAAASGSGSVGTSFLSTAISRAKIDLGGYTNGTYMDELRLGTTFTDVAPLVPEPASLALMSLGGLALLRRKRAAI